MKSVCPRAGLPKQINPGWKVGIVYSSFYKTEVSVMVDSAKETLMGAGIHSGDIMVFETAGCFEIPLIGAALAENEIADALMGLGIVVQGETNHAQTIVEQAARGMMDVQIKYRVPFAFEVLHVNSLEDAQARIKDKGKEAALAVLHSLCQLRRV